MNPYEILGVKKDATIEEISEVFRRLAKKYHPDAAGSDKERKANENKFILITQAYNSIKSEHVNVNKQTVDDNIDYIGSIINKSKRFINSKDYNSAIRILKGLKDKDNDDVNMLLGEAYFRKGRYHEALYHFKLVYNKKPWDIKVKLKMAGVYEKIGLKNTSKKLYQEVLSMDSLNETALKRLSEMDKKSTFSLSSLFKKR